MRRGPGGTEGAKGRQLNDGHPPRPGPRPFRYPARWASLLAGGVPVVLVFPDLSLSYVAWFALVPGIIVFTRSGTAREAVARGWWFGAGYLLAMMWFFAPEIGPAVLLIGGVFGAMWSPFAIACWQLLRPGPRPWPRFLAALAVLPATWLIPEWIRSYQGLGGPWDLYGASQWQHPAVLALAAVGGVWLVSVALVIANAGIAATVIAWLRMGGPRRPGLAAAGLAALVASAGAGPLAFALTPPLPVARAVTVALVQPGIDRHPTPGVNASQALTASLTGHAAAAGVRPDLIVWGESSVGEDLTLPSSAPLLRQIEALAARDGAEILAGQDASPPGRGHEKWAVLISPAGIKGIYVKSRLVPFGEYIPFRQELGWLASISEAARSNMIPGPGARVITATDRAGRPLPVGVLVCFESAFPDMSRADADNGAQLVVYQSATVTFQGTWGPEQHASLAAIRAAETGRPVVQAALTGDTAAFDARGRELAWLGQSGHGVVTVRLELPAGPARTFYDRAGDYVLWTGVAVSATFLLFLVAGPAALRRRGFLAHTTGAGDGGAAEYGADTGQPV